MEQIRDPGSLVHMRNQDRAAEYRHEAEEIRSEAGRMINDAVRLQFLDMARRYDFLAESLEAAKIH